MNRFESIGAMLVVAVLACAHAPVLAQTVIIDGQTVVDGGKVKGKSRKPKPEKPPAKPKTPTFTVSGGFESTKEKARASAITAAIEKVHEYMQQQDPPVERMPTAEFVRRLLLNDQEKVQSMTEIRKELDAASLDDEKADGTERVAKELPAILGDQEMYRATVAVRIDPDHVRELRSRDRSSEGMGVVAGLIAVSLIAAGFFKIDAWTKGYLTSWLVLGLVGAGVVVLGLMILG